METTRNREQGLLGFDEVGEPVERGRDIGSRIRVEHLDLSEAGFTRAWQQNRGWV